MKQVFTIIGIFTLLNIVLVGLGVGAFFWRFVPRLPNTTFSAPSNHTEAREQDLTYLLNLLDVDRSFSPEATVKFQKQIVQLRTEATTMNDHDGWFF